ncbi:MAG: hypothetical protein KDI98_07055 [Hyphomicrobiaceae bacterium]|nr:hypothetical protein [Hyphomicrobiaceae bacterium]
MQDGKAQDRQAAGGPEAAAGASEVKTPATLTVEELQRQRPYFYHRILAAIPRKLLHGEPRWAWTSVTTRELDFFQKPEDVTEENWRAPVLHEVRLDPVGDDGQPIFGQIVERHDLAHQNDPLVFLGYDDASFDRAFGGGKKCITAETARGYVEARHPFTTDMRLDRHLLTLPDAVDALAFEPAMMAQATEQLEQLLAQQSGFVPSEDAPEARLRAALKAPLGLPAQKDEDGDFHFPVLRCEGRDLDLMIALVFADGRFATHYQGTLLRLSSSPQVPDRLGLEHPWIGQPDFDLAYRESGRRKFTAMAFREERLVHKVWMPDGATEDREKVRKEAEEAFSRRLEAHDWQAIWPPEAPGTDDTALTEEAKDFIGVVNDRCPDLYLDPDPKASNCRIRRWVLSFWPGYALYDVQETEGITPKRTRILWCSDTAVAPGMAPLDLVPLDGTSPPVHAINARMVATNRMALTDDQALDYIRFFCDVVHGDGGAFTVIERLDDLDWRGLSDAQQAEMASLIHPLRPWPSLQDAGGQPGLRASATVLYARSLFRALFRLEKGGMIEMLDDQHLEPRLQIMPRLWAENTHFYLGGTRAIASSDPETPEEEMPS